MNQKEFAQSIGAEKSAITRWKNRGWIVFYDDGSVDAEASKARLIERRPGGLDFSRATNARQGAHLSYWRKEPACKTRNAFLSFQEIRGGAA